MKGSFLLVLIASALLLSGASNGGSDKTHQNQTGTDNRSTNGKTNPTPPTVNIVVQPAPVQIIQPSTPVEKKQPAQKWYQRPSATDWGILAVTLFYTLISLGLLDATRRQAILAKAAAEAAKESADIARRALTVLEVPYVSIYDIVPHVLRTHGTQEGPRPNAVIWFEYNLKNHGRSVAEVTAVHGELRIMDNLPIPPDYNGIIDQSAFAIGPNSDTGKVRWTVSYKFPTDNVDEEFESIWAEGNASRVLAMFITKTYLGLSGLADLAGNGIQSTMGRTLSADAPTTTTSAKRLRHRTPACPSENSSRANSVRSETLALLTFVSKLLLGDRALQRIY